MAQADSAPRLISSTPWVESSLISMLVHMVIMIVLGLILIDSTERQSMQIVSSLSDDTTEQPIVADPEATPSTKIEVATLSTLLAVNSTDVSDPFGSPSGPQLTLSGLGNEFAKGSPIAGNETAEKAAQGIGERLGGEFAKRLERAGGQTGDVQVTLVWDNYNDLDLHVMAPSTEQISYRNKRSRCGGYLDVDMNVPGNMSIEPVENVFWPTGEAPPGSYRVIVHYFARHDEKKDATPFRVAVKINGEVKTFYGVVSTSRRQVVVGSYQRRTTKQP